jgi:lysophospholipase L1-like esterase
MVAAFVIGEVALRILTPSTLRTAGRTLPPMYVEDEKLGWRLKPNFEGGAKTDEFSTEIKINSDGFRDYEHSNSNNESTFRILGLGDSFTLGYGVELEETYLSVLEKYLNSSQDDNNTLFEIFNTGIPGYSIKEECLLFEEIVSRIQPDLITIGFDINDHTDCINPLPKWKVVDGYIVSRGNRKQTLVSKFKLFLHKHSYLYSYLSISKNRVITRIRRREKAITEKEVEQKKEMAWESAANYLDRIHKRAKANGAELLIVYIPHRSQVHPGLRQDRHVIKEYFNNLDELLEIFCRQNNISYVNLLPQLTDASGKGQQLYYIVTDAHWNSNGHELAARGIYDFLVQELSLKEDK